MAVSVGQLPSAAFLCSVCLYGQALVLITEFETDLSNKRQTGFKRSMPGAGTGPGPPGTAREVRDAHGCSHFSESADRSVVVLQL